MKIKFLIYALIVAAVSSCSMLRQETVPVMTKNLDKDYNFDFAGKSVAVIIFGDDVSENGRFATEIKRGIEGRLLWGRDVKVFPKSLPDAKYNPTKEDMIKYVIETQKDVILLIVPDKAGNIELYHYDSMSSKDTVEKFYPASLSHNAFLKGNLSYELVSYMQKKAVQWRENNIGLFVFWNDDWLSAYYEALDQNWEKALDMWLYLYGADNKTREFAAYNIAVACYVLGKPELSIKWLKEYGEKNVPGVKGLYEYFNKNKGY